MMYIGMTSAGDLKDKVNLPKLGRPCIRLSTGPRRDYSTDYSTTP